MLYNLLYIMHMHTFYTFMTYNIHTWHVCIVHVHANMSSHRLNNLTIMNVLPLTSSKHTYRRRIQQRSSPAETSSVDRSTRVLQLKLQRIHVMIPTPIITLTLVNQFGHQSTCNTCIFKLISWCSRWIAAKKRKKKLFRFRVVRCVVRILR